MANLLSVEQAHAKSLELGITMVDVKIAESIVDTFRLMGIGPEQARRIIKFLNFSFEVVHVNGPGKPS